ncbi:MAG: transglycosylase domain-containing protein [Deltaproteobacteria bacterium]|nr:transglycosylase domain-containing protein [Deltaproteobacteria bacterium]
MKLRVPSRAWNRWLLRIALALTALAILPFLVFAVAVRLGRFPVEKLAPERTSSLTVLDQQGNVLRQRSGGAGTRETWVPLDRISEHLQDATVASEDHRFTSHGGVDALALLRAAWLDLRARRLAYGGSTLTMQLVRMALPRSRGFRNKLREMVLAGRLERALSKRQILEQVLNRAYYGHGAWGAEAAARFYFGRGARELSLGEASLLAVLPRGPDAYDPFRHLDRALRRRRHVLKLMERHGFCAKEDRELAERTPLVFARARPEFRAPHFVDWVTGTLPPEFRRAGTVRTTLDGPLQEALEVATLEHLKESAHLGISQAALVVLRNRDGAVLGFVGSRDYFDAKRNGATSGVLARQRPGSTLKPFVYALALERGDAPATVAFDVVLPGEVRSDHTLDVKQHGFARYREALAGSYNLAAVHTLARVGVPALLKRLRKAGLKTLDWPDERYGVNLAIGEAEVRLLELTSAFAAFGNMGRAVSATGVTVALSPTGTAWHPPANTGNQVFSPRIAWLIFDILSDPDARRPMFGDRVPLHLPFPVALKTGTTRAYTDNWALGTTAEYTVGVWAGNFDGSPTHQIMAMRGATPLLRAAFAALAARFGDPTPPPRPDGIEEADVCPLSGMRPGPHCPARKRERFLMGTAPTEPCTWHHHACGRIQVRYPEVLEGWARAQGLTDPHSCPAPVGDGRLRIVAPADGARFTIDPHRPLERQVPPFRAIPSDARVSWRIDGVDAGTWRPSRGEHVIEARLGQAVDSVRVLFE